MEGQLSLFDFEISSNEEEIKEPLHPQDIKKEKEKSQFENNEEKHYIGEQVEVQYGDDFYIGIITRIYNNGDTINCLFYGDKITAFYKGVVKSII